MAYIKTKEELKNFILRKLGSEAHKVEISDENWEDIYNESLKYLYEYFDEAVVEKTMVLELNKVTDIKLNENIIAVHSMHTSANDLGLYLAYPGLSPVLDFVSDGDRNAVSSYLATMTYIRELQQVFEKKVYFKFNSETHRLIIGEPITKCIIVVLEAEDELSLLNSRYFHLILEANFWNTWANNVGGKYKGWTVGNGMEINVEGMRERYNTLMEQIKDSIENDEFSFLGPIRLNSL